jgi:hypothetical protein
MFHGLPELLPRSPVPILSDVNDGDMNDINLPFSIQIFEFQTAGNALSSRIVEHIRRQSPELRTTNGPLCSEGAELNPRPSNQDRILCGLIERRFKLSGGNQSTLL